MRVWTSEDRGDHACIRLPLTGIAFCINDPPEHYFASVGEMAQFIVDALNAAEHDDETRLRGQRLIDATQAIINEKTQLLADIDRDLAERNRRMNA